MSDLAAATRVLATALAAQGLGERLRVTGIDPVAEMVRDPVLAEGVEAGLREAADLARCLVESARDAVIGLATALMERRVLLGDEVVAILEGDRRSRARRAGEAVRDDDLDRRPPPEAQMTPVDLVRALAVLEVEHGPAALATALRRCRAAVALTTLEAVSPPAPKSTGRVVRFPIGRRRAPGPREGS